MRQKEPKMIPKMRFLLHNSKKSSTFAVAKVCNIYININMDRNCLIISKVRMVGGKNQLCILRTLCVVIVCAFCCAACSKPQPSKTASSASERSSAVQVRKSLFHNPDSLLYYAAPPVTRPMWV